jgi:hypothetical protein
MFSEAGELQLAASLATGDFAAGLSGRNVDFDFQTAFSLTEHLGLMGNFSVTDAGHHVRYPSLYRHHWFTEGGIGYYTSSDEAFLEIFSGVGTGYGKSTYEDSCPAPIIGEATRYNRFFLQPALGWRIGDHHLSIISRFSFVHFSHYGEARQPASVVFLEPGIQGKINLNNHVYIQWQAAPSRSFSKMYPGTCLDHVPVHFSFGVGGRLGAGKEKVKSPHQ